MKQWFARPSDHISFGAEPIDGLDWKPGLYVIKCTIQMGAVKWSTVLNVGWRNVQ